MNGATYSRVSTEDQGERGTSLVTQEAACLTLLIDQGYQVSSQYRIRDEFTGATLLRPGLLRLRQFVREGQLDAVAYYTADRLSRDSIDLMILLREFRRAGIEVLAVHNPPTDDPLGRAITFMQGTFAEVERREIAERTMRGKVEAAKGGRLPQGTGVGIFGYDYDSSTKTRNINNDQAQLVQRIFTMVSEGYSLHGIAVILNREGQRTLTGKLWHPLTIKRMVTNQTYAGNSFFGKTRRVTQDGSLVRIENRPESEWIPVPGATPPIVTPEEFQQVQLALNAPRQRLVSPPANYLLRGHARCGLCGGAMTGTILSRRYRYYQCTNARKVAERPVRCVAKYVRADPLEEAVLVEVKRVLENPNVVVSELKRRQAEASPDGIEGLKRIQREGNRLSREERRLVKLFRFGEVNEQFLRDEIKDIRQRQAALEEEKKESEKNRRLLSTLESKEEDMENLCSLVRENLEKLDYAGQRQALDALDAKVVVSPHGSILYGYLPSYVTIAQTSA